MSQQHLRRIKKITLIASGGMLFSALSCVMNATDVVGTGLSITSGLLGPAAGAANSIGTGFDVFADLLRFGFG